MDQIQDYDLSDKKILITGANSGIGKASAFMLAKMGAYIIIICRNQVSAEETKKELKEQFPNALVDIVIADFSSLADVKRAATYIIERYPRLDVLINNAGVFNWTRVLTSDGFESTVGVNYLAHFAFTLLILDLLKKGSPSRIINVSSDIHRFMGINIADFMSKNKYNSQKAYSNSKTALVLFTYFLSDKLKKENIDITVNALHPGHVKTRMTTTDNKIYNFFTKLFNIYVSPEIAAQTQVFLASSPEIQQITGKYFKNCQPIKSHKITYMREVQEQLWNLSMDWIKPIIGELKTLKATSY